MELECRLSHRVWCHMDFHGENLVDQCGGKPVQEPVDRPCALPVASTGVSCGDLMDLD